MPTTDNLLEKVNADEVSFDKKEVKHKDFSFNIEKCYETKDNGVLFGVIEGYASTFEKDRGGDIIMPGAFKKSLKRHKKLDRPIRMLFQHYGENLIGGFPSDQAKEDDKGLFVTGHINLEVQKGREAYALAKQGVLTDMSIGYSIQDYDYDAKEGTAYLKEIELWEISLVSEPMNAGAKITNVKSIDEFGCMKDIENFLKDPVSLSGQQRKVFISKIKQFSEQRDVADQDQRDVDKINDTINLSSLNTKIDDLLKIFK